MIDEDRKHSVLTVREVAAYLGVAPVTVYRAASNGVIPGAFRINGRWRFRMEQIDRWTRSDQGGSAPATRNTER